MTAFSKRFLAFCLLIVAVATGGSLAYWRARTVAVEAGGPGVRVAAASVGPMAAGSGAAAASSSSGVAAAAVSLAAGGVADEEGPPVPPEGVEFCGVRHVSADELRHWKADKAHAQAELKQLEEQMLSLGKAGLTRLSTRLAVGSDRQQVAARLLMRDLDGAASLAERSSDVQAYQMALSACGGGLGGNTPHCARLNPRRWAELDPSDARPWLRLMGIAQRNRDAAGVEAALAEAATRPRWSRASFLLESHVVAVADAVPDAGALGQALVLAIGFDAAMDGIWDVPVLGRVCKGEALRDATRLRHCSALAPQILANTRDISEAMAAQGLADRLGVPREQQAHDAATLKAVRERFQTLALPDLNPSCGSMQDVRQFSTERAASGDLGMALAALPARQKPR